MVNLAPTHRAIRAYYLLLEDFAKHRAAHEGATSTAFQTLLQDVARERDWTLVPQQRHRTAAHRSIAPDGTLRDDFDLIRGYWEAKDTSDDLATEIRAKIQKGYPLTNIIFEDTRTAVLYQDRQPVFTADLANPVALADLLNLFLNYSEPNIEKFEQAVAEFGERVGDLARGLVDKVQQAHKDNARFQTAFDKFYALAKKSLNPNLSVAAVDEMLVQHLLTVRLITTVFDNPYFLQRNVIAKEVEGVIRALTSKAFDPRQFLAGLDRFYDAIEKTGRDITEWSEKQDFLNRVYERFFQGYSIKTADTHGIVYTPQPIVDFMVSSVAEVLQREFGTSLGDPSVVILDPATGTGNFIINLLRRLPQRDIEDAYRHRIFANEVMLMPYYIASLNIEHEYATLTGNYEPFEGICFVDTLDLTERQQLTFDFLTEENSERVNRQREAPITVIIGNPPYNVGQINENDNNKNRRYDDHEKAVDHRIRETYSKDSKATLNTKLYDAYVRFFRWATDRLGDRDGLICFVSNNGFLDGIAFDGFRQHLEHDFDSIYHFDLKGNARTSGERRRKEGGNIFDDQIRTGIGITLLIRKGNNGKAQVHIHRVEDYWKSDQKREYLQSFRSYRDVPWIQAFPDSKNTWLVPENANEYKTFIPIGSKDARAEKLGAENVVFEEFSLGVSTNRDNVVYDFQSNVLFERIRDFSERYNSEVDRYKRHNKRVNIDDFVDYTIIKWSSTLKNHLIRQKYLNTDDTKVRRSMYRPYTRKYLYYDTITVDRLGRFHRIFPTVQTELENKVIWLKVGSTSPMFALMANSIVDLLTQSGSQCFPFYVYDQDGTNRRENITDWAVDTFRAHYRDNTITKWDIFHYIYALLHHPRYRTRYADNLKRELPRIPFARLATDEESAALPLSTLETRQRQGGEVSVFPLPLTSAVPPSDSEREQAGKVAALPLSDSETRQRSGGEVAVPPRSDSQTPQESEIAGLPLSKVERGQGGEVSVFHTLAAIGKTLATLHLNYETVTPYRLDWVETATPLSYRVEKMRLSADKTQLIVNPTLTLRGIPPAAFDYRVGSPSALDWIIDQYQITTDKRSGITSDPNRADDPRYIVNLIERIVTVSIETNSAIDNMGRITW